MKKTITATFTYFRLGGAYAPPNPKIYKKEILELTIPELKKLLGEDYKKIGWNEEKKELCVRGYYGSYLCIIKI